VMRAWKPRMELRREEGFKTYASKKFSSDETF
jgi:hypothetical protein